MKGRRNPNIRYDSPIRRWISDKLREKGITDPLQFRQLCYDYFKEHTDIDQSRYISKASDLMKPILGQCVLGRKTAGIIIEYISY